MLKENLVILRRLNGYSQEQVAEKIGISRQAYAKWESGATVPDVEKAASLAQVYGVTIDGLLRTETLDGVGIVPPAQKGKNIWGNCHPRGTGADCHTQGCTRQAWDKWRRPSDRCKR